MNQPPDNGSVDGAREMGPPVQKRPRFDEMAATDLARVFFHTVGEETIVKTAPRVKHLEKVVSWMEQKVAFYEAICPPCATMKEGFTPDDLYCFDCETPLSCMDWKSHTCLAG
jgi:hypothetical protein